MIRPALTHKARLCSAYNVLIKWHWDCYHLTCLISSFLEFLWRLGGPLATLGFSLQTRNKALIIAIRILLSKSFIIALKRILSIFWFYRVKKFCKMELKVYYAYDKITSFFNFRIRPYACHCCIWRAYNNFDILQ